MITDLGKMKFDVHVVDPTEGDLLRAALEDSQVMNYVAFGQFAGSEVTLEGKFTSAQLREIADVLETP